MGSNYVVKLKSSNLVNIILKSNQMMFSKELVIFASGPTPRRVARRVAPLLSLSNTLKSKTVKILALKGSKSSCTIFHALQNNVCNFLSWHFLRWSNVIKRCFNKGFYFNFEIIIVWWLSYANIQTTNEYYSSLITKISFVL